MQRPVNQASPNIRPVYDGVAQRSADAGRRPVGSGPSTRDAVSYVYEDLPEVTGVELLLARGFGPDQKLRVTQ
jgi:hypothetical protein